MRAFGLSLVLLMIVALPAYGGQPPSASPGQKETDYDGKPLSYWVGLLTDQTAEARQAAGLHCNSWTQNACGEERPNRKVRPCGSCDPTAIRTVEWLRPLY